ncbi:MAG: DUF5615 family PIN-like protein [Nitrospirae bacterium]|nr:DUF5615 family PIN-like protein [Nitrospirota bacterium]
MRIIVDENIPLMTANELRSLGHNVMDIRGTDLEGTDDKELWKIVLKEKRLLITTDKGFVRNRHEKCLSQREVAKRAKITHQQLSRLENGINCTMATFLKVCYALGIKVDIEPPKITHNAA